MIRLQSHDVVLRPLRSDELDAVVQGRARVARGAQPAGVPPRARLAARVQRSGQLVRGQLDLGVEVGGRLVGEIQGRGRPRQSLPAGVFQLGIVIYDPADRGKGYGAQAVLLLTGWLFDQADAARVQAGTAVDNLAMRRVLEGLGFACEGILRAFMPTAGGRADCALYGVIRDDWQGQAVHEH